MKAMFQTVRTEYGKRMRKMYEGRVIKMRRQDIRMFVPRNDGIANTVTTVTKDLYVYEDSDEC